MEKYQEPPNNAINSQQEAEQEEREGGVFNQSENDLPSWATSNNHLAYEDIKSPIAECEGCIAEQRIEHTCRESIPESEAAHRDLDRSYSHDSIASFSLGCNTWPKKRHKPKKSVKEIFAMVDPSPPPVESIMEQPQTRVLRGTGAPMNILPDELQTVKKGTPLYGQPEWWGEEDSDLNKQKQRSSKVMEVVLPDNPADSGAPARTPVSPATPSDTPASDNTVPCTTTPDKKATRPSDHEGIANMAFTVDFGDESSKNVGGKSLSDFMPSKIRKSFRERQEKSLEKTSTSSKSSTKVLTEPAKLHSKQDKDSAESVKSSPKDKVVLESKSSFRDKMMPEKHQPPKGMGRAQSEGRDFSPTRQHKLDELWGSGSSSTESALSKRQRMMGKSTASRSMDLEGEGQESSLDTKVKPSSVVKRRAPYSASSKPKSVIRARKAVSQEILASSTQYSNDHAAVYLIDKMFQNNSTGSVDSLKTRDTSSALTEYDLYHESIKFDVDQSKLLQQDLSISSSFTAGKDTKKVKTRSKEVPTTIVQKKSKEPEIVTAKATNKKEEDKISESGTYTIEEEKDSKEEEEARKNIDKVFGVDQVSFNGELTLTEDLQLVHRSPGKQGDLTLNLANINNELQEIERLERLRAKRTPADSLEVDIGSREPSDLLEDEDNPTVPADAPTWVTQWAALTNKKPQNSAEMELSSPGSSISDDRDSKSSGKTPNGLSRKRPGTGRRLPTIPPEATSPAVSDRSFTKDSPQTPKTDLSINGTMLSPGQRTVKISSHVSSRYQDTDTESISLTKVNDDSSEVGTGISARGKTGSNGSVVSIDTEVLLRDTETVMAAMQQRVDKSNESEEEDDYENGDALYSENIDDFSDKQDISRQSASDNTDSYLLNDSADLESDTSSVVALVNGDEDFVKPSTFKSPRDVLGRGKLKLTESLPSKPSVNISGAKAKTTVGERLKRRSVEERTVVSDVYSEDNVTDRDSAQFTRQGSKGKGQMSMTRPNRAFALRRARADAEDGVETSRSTSQLSIASSGFSTPRGSGSLTNVSKVSTTPQKPRRPMSGKFADREPDSGRSQASLGAQIVQKSRDNQSLSQSQSFGRADGGRHSLRVSRSMSIPAHPSPGSSGNKQRRSAGVGTPSSQLQHSKSLRVTGVGARERSSSLSKHGTGANSPKTAERNAWKRRKEYDPRKAVADAKSKGRDSSKPKSRESSSSHRGRGVTRSASFNNTKDLKLSSYQCDSLSSADEYSRRSSGVSDVFEDEPRRGFVPYSGRSIVSSKVSNSSADDDELDRYARSSSTVSTQSYDTLIVSSVYQLSLKLKTLTDRTMQKLRESEVIENGLDSPLDELETQSAISEIPAYKSANQELAGVLKNLRKLEQHIKVMNRVLFPEEEQSPDTSKEKHEYMQQIERIRNELAGFQPIETPREEVWKQTDTQSVESDCEELSHGDYY